MRKVDISITERYQEWVSIPTDGPWSWYELSKDGSAGAESAEICRNDLAGGDWKVSRPHGVSLAAILTPLQVHELSYDLKITKDPNGKDRNHDRVVHLLAGLSEVSQYGAPLVSADISILAMETDH